MEQKTIKILLCMAMFLCTEFVRADLQDALKNTVESLKGLGKGDCTEQRSSKGRIISN